MNYVFCHNKVMRTFPFINVSSCTESNFFPHNITQLTSCTKLLMSLYSHTVCQREELQTNMALREKYTLGQLDAFDSPVITFIYYNWINQLSNTTIWWLDICCLLRRYQLHVSALMAIFRLNELTANL